MTRNQRFALVEHASPDELLLSKGFVADDAEYLKTFAKPQMSGREPICLACQQEMGFSWDLAHGEGRCKCGWPARALHYFETKNEHDDGIQTRRVIAILQWHPENVKYPNKAKPRR